jgi:hypothetical protein
MSNNAQPLTKETCLWIADQIEAGFNQYSIRIVPTSDIGVFVKDMRWLSDHLDPACLPFNDADGKKWRDALFRTTQAFNIAFTFQGLRDTTIPPSKFDRIQQTLDVLNERGNSQAPDNFFELEIAGRLSKHLAPNSIAFEEPDIVINYPSGKVGIACKYLQSKKKLPTRINEAAIQGQRTGMPYLVMVDVSQLYRSNIGAKGIHVDTKDELISDIDDFVSQLMSNQMNSINKAFEKGAGGVVISARGIGFVNKPALSWNWHTIYKEYPNVNFVNAGDTLNWLTGLLKS